MDQAYDSPEEERSQGEPCLFLDSSLLLTATHNRPCFCLMLHAAVCIRGGHSQVCGVGEGPCSIGGKTCFVLLAQSF